MIEKRENQEKIDVKELFEDQNISNANAAHQKRRDREFQV
jgi:hypothetical protein